MTHSALHTISKSLHDQVWLFEQLAFTRAGDTILLMQDAVLATHSRLSLGSFVAKCQAKGVAIVALSDDLQLRGVQNYYSEISLVDYAGFVALVARHEKQVAW